MRSLLLRSIRRSITRNSTQLRFASSFAVIDHSAAYESQMKSKHGQQLELAKLEGIGKDDEDYDPFQELEELDGLEDDIDVESEGEDDESADEQDAEEQLQDMASSGEISEVDDEVDDIGSEDPLETKEMESIYNSDGSLKRKKSERATLRAGFPSGGSFAIIELAGSQYKITNDDLLIVNKIKPVDKFKVGSIHTIDDVLLVGSTHMTLVGMPHVAGAQVDLMVEEITRDKKVVVFKHKRRKNYKRKTGHRRDVTMLRVLDVRFPEQYQDHPRVTRPSPEQP